MTRTQRETLAQHRRRLLWHTAAPLALSVALLSAGLAFATDPAPISGTLQIEAAVQYLAPGASFTARVVENASVPMSGFGATVTFDPALLQITAVARGAAYADAPVFNGASANAIAAANTTGSLAGVGSSYFPPDTVPAGDADAVDITFHAVGCGTAQLGLPAGVNAAAVLDGSDGNYGNALPVTTAGATIVVCNSLRIDPAVTSVAPDGSFTARVVENASVPMSGFGATVTFDPALLQITAVARGAAYADAPVFNGASANAIAAANTTGSLAGVGSSYFPPDTVPAGDADAVDITFHAVGCGTAQLGLPAGVNAAAVLDGSDGNYGNALPVTTAGATITTCVAPTPTPTATPTPTPTPTSSGAGSPSPSPSPTGSPSPSPSPSPTPPPGNTIRLLPSSTTVDKEGTFSVRVVQHGEVPIGGITATVAFDPTILQITGITASAAYSTKTSKVPALAEGSLTTTIANANVSGRTQIVGSFQVDAATKTGDAVPAGDADFITIQFKAVACGNTPLLLPGDTADNQLLDGRPATYGKTVATGAAGGSVSVCTSTATSAPTLPSGNALRMVPYTSLVVQNGGFTVKVTQTASVATGGTTATILFDPTMLQIVSITKSDAFAASSFFQGATPAAIRAANSSGRLNQVAAAFNSPASVPAGEADFISIVFKSIACGESLLLLPNDPALTSVLDGRVDSYGQVLGITTVKGVVQACDKNAKPTPRPTATPAPTRAPTTAPTVAPTAAPTQPPSSDSTPPTTGDSFTPSPSDSPAAGTTPAAKPTPSGKVALAVAPVKRSTAVATMAPASMVGFVGLGVAGVFVALVIVLLMAAAMVGSLVIPLVVVRTLRARNGGHIGNAAAKRD